MTVEGLAGDDQDEGAELVDGELVPESGEVVGWLIRDGGTIRAEVREGLTLEDAEIIELIGLLVSELPPTLANMTALMQRIAPGEVPFAPTSVAQ